MGTVYLITNTVNGKVYVGQTRKTIDHRWNEHCQTARLGSNKPLYLAIRKHGPQSFTKNVLAHAPTNQLNCMERIWVFLLNSQHPFGYNLTAGGDGILEVHDVRDQKKHGARLEQLQKDVTSHQKHVGR